MTKDTESNPQPKAEAAQPAPLNLESVYSQKIDMCLTDAIVKTGTCLLLGGLTSLLFFRARRWPVIAASGIGVGLAWANCENELNQQTKQGNI